MKPRKTLKGATFIGRTLWADKPGDPTRWIKTSKVIKRLGPTTFETMNSIYDVEFVKGGEATIPEDLTVY